MKELKHEAIGWTKGYREGRYQVLMKVLKIIDKKVGEYERIKEKINKKDRYYTPKHHRLAGQITTLKVLKKQLKEEVSNKWNLLWCFKIVMF